MQQTGITDIQEVINTTNIQLLALLYNIGM